MKKRNTTLMKMIVKERRVKTLKLIISIVLFIIFTVIINSLIKENMELRSSLMMKDETIAELNNTISELNEIVKDTDIHLRQVADVNQSYVDELNTLRNRAELYDKYEYAIVYSGERTALTYEEIQFGEELMLAKGYDPDLMFGSIMVESNANPDAVNKYSGATGYGQFLDSTAKWIWTAMLGNSTYYSDLRKDGKSNILMMATYYDYLYSVTGNTFKVIKCYSGNSTDSGTKEYIARINKFINKVGAQLEF